MGVPFFNSKLEMMFDRDQIEMQSKRVTAVVVASAVGSITEPKNPKKIEVEITELVADSNGHVVERKISRNHEFGPGAGFIQKETLPCRCQVDTVKDLAK